MKLSQDVVNTTYDVTLNQISQTFTCERQVANIHWLQRTPWGSMLSFLCLLSVFFFIAYIEKRQCATHCHNHFQTAKTILTTKKAKQNDNTSAMTHNSKFTNGKKTTGNPKTGAMENYNEVMHQQPNFAWINLWRVCVYGSLHTWCLWSTKAQCVSINTFSRTIIFVTTD